MKHFFGRLLLPSAASLPLIGFHIVFNVTGMLSFPKRYLPVVQAHYVFGSVGPVFPLLAV